MKNSIHIFMFVDALGWEIVTRYKFMEDLFPYRCKVKMQFGYSSTAIPTILTGQPPVKHKHLSFYYYAPEKSPFKLFKYLPMGLLPKSIFNRWRVRHMFSKLIARYYGFSGYFELYAMPYERLPFLDYIEKNDIFVTGGTAPLENLADVLLKHKIKGHISNWRKSEQENIDALSTDLDTGEIDFAFLYTAALDGMLHIHVEHPEVIAEKLK